MTVEECINGRDNCYNGLYNVYRYITDYNNSEVNEYVLNVLNSEIDASDIFNQKLKLEETAYGVLLAKNIGYELNKDKFQNYVNYLYDTVNDEQEVCLKITQLYYTMIKAVSKGADNIEIAKTERVAALVVLDKVFGCKLISEELLLDRYYALSDDGGSRSREDKWDKADIGSTYKFFVCIRRYIEENEDVLQAQRGFVRTLEVIPGIYMDTETIDGMVSLKAILYGNCIQKSVQ